MSARRLIKDLSEQLWPLLETEKDRERWLTVALADLPELRREIDLSGNPSEFTVHLFAELLTRQGLKGRQGLLNLLDDIADQKGEDWEAKLKLFRDQVAVFVPGTEESVSPPPELLALRNQLLEQAAPTALDLSTETVQAILRYRPRDLTEYRLARIAEWSQPRYALDKRFVHLVLLLDQGEEASGTRWAEQDREFQDLGSRAIG